MTYNEFISEIINTRGQWTIPECGIYESHHIIPRCLGGEPKYCNRTAHHPNLIWLSPYEHFTAHRLLYEEHKENYNLRAAFVCMRQKTTKIMELTEEEFNLLKAAAKEHGREAYLKNKNFMKLGGHHTEETKLKIGKAVSGEKNGMYGKPCTYRMSESEIKEWRKKILLADKRRITIKCIETGEEFNSIREAGRKYNLDHNRIRRYIKSGKAIDGLLTFVKLETLE